MVLRTQAAPVPSFPGACTRAGLSRTPRTLLCWDTALHSCTCQQFLPPVVSSNLFSWPLSAFRRSFSSSLPHPPSPLQRLLCCIAIQASGFERFPLSFPLVVFALLFPFLPFLPKCRTLRSSFPETSLESSRPRRGLPPPHSPADLSSRLSSSPVSLYATRQ